MMKVEIPIAERTGYVLHNRSKCPEDVKSFADGHLYNLEETGGCWRCEKGPCHLSDKDSPLRKKGLLPITKNGDDQLKLHWFHRMPIGGGGAVDPPEAEDQQREEPMDVPGPGKQQDMPF